MFLVYMYTEFLLGARALSRLGVVSWPFRLTNS